jgi:hypothetical protein
MYISVAILAQALLLRPASQQHLVMAAAASMEAILKELRTWPAAQAVLGAVLGASACGLSGKPLQLTVQAAARGATQGCWQEERPEALPDLRARLDVIGKEMEARAAMARVAGEEFTHGEQASRWAHTADPQLGSLYRQAKRQRNRAVHQLGPKPASSASSAESTMSGGGVEQHSEDQAVEARKEEAAAGVALVVNEEEEDVFADGAPMVEVGAKFGWSAIKQLHKQAVGPAPGAHAEVVQVGISGPKNDKKEDETKVDETLLPGGGGCHGLGGGQKSKKVAVKGKQFAMKQQRIFDVPQAEFVDELAMEAGREDVDFAAWACEALALRGTVCTMTEDHTLETAAQSTGPLRKPMRGFTLRIWRPMNGQRWRGGEAKAGP